MGIYHHYVYIKNTGPCSRLKKRSIFILRNIRQRIFFDFVLLKRIKLYTLKKFCKVLFKWFWEAERKIFIFIVGPLRESEVWQRPGPLGRKLLSVIL